MSTEPSQQPSEFDAFEPSPAPKKQLKPGKWFGFIALLCGLETVVAMCYAFLVMPFMPCCTSPWQEIAMALVFGSLICAPAGIVFGILGLKTEGRRYAWSGLVLSLLYGLVILAYFAYVFWVIPREREAEKEVRCVINMREIAQAFQDYADVNGAFPPLYTVDDEGKPLHSWRVLILPFLKRQQNFSSYRAPEHGLLFFVDPHHLYEQIRLDEPWDSEHNRQFHSHMPIIYQCPKHLRVGCYYSAIAGGSSFPATEVGSVIGLCFEDVSRTMILVEVTEPFNWMDPTADVTLEEFVKRERVGTCSRQFWMRAAYSDGSIGSPLDDASQEFLRKTATPNSVE